VLPDILGKSVTTGAEDNGLIMSCAGSYNDWFCNDDGVMTGVKPQIMEGIVNQRAVHKTILDNHNVTRPVGSTMDRKLLHHS
jgi:hypothetical protein